MQKVRQSSKETTSQRSERQSKESPPLQMGLFPPCSPSLLYKKMTTPSLLPPPESWELQFLERNHLLFLAKVSIKLFLKNKGGEGQRGRKEKRKDFFLATGWKDIPGSKGLESFCHLNQETKKTLHVPPDGQTDFFHSLGQNAKSFPIGGTTGNERESRQERRGMG